MIAGNRVYGFGSVSSEDERMALENRKQFFREISQMFKGKKIKITVEEFGLNITHNQREYSSEVWWRKLSRDILRWE
jgi:hypothetical protein